MSPHRGGGWNRAANARLEGWLGLAARGWQLFPVRPASKVPAISQWSQRATTDPDRLSRFFRAHPNHNAGIACGPSGLLVVDCDVTKDGHPVTRWRDGAAVLADLAALHGGAPPTWTVATPSGGRHLYYAAPADRVLGNTSRILGPLLDTRGDGGQVLAPGSVLPVGGYELLDDTDPAPLPGWLATQLTPPPPAATAAAVVGAEVGRPLSARHTAYVASAVAAETERVRRAGRGGHNTAVFTAANALGQLVGAGALDRAEAEAAITAAAEHICTGPCDCTPCEVAASIRSGLDRGTHNPRHLPAGPTTTRTRSRTAGGDHMTPQDHSDSTGPARPDDPTTPATTPADPIPSRTPLTPEQELAVAGASWAIAVRDAAIEDGDATAAVWLDELARGAVGDVGASGIDQDRLAVELDYQDGAAAMLDPPELGDPDFRPRQDLTFDPTLAATTPEEATRWLTARTGNLEQAEHILGGYQAAVRTEDPSANWWVGALSPHKLEYLAQGGARPGETFEAALRRIEQTESEDLISVDADNPIPYVLTDAVAVDIGDDPAVVARWAPVGPDEETFTPRAAAARLTERGLTDERAVAAVAAYLDTAGRDTGTDMRPWGLDTHDVEAITRTAAAGDPDMSIAAIPTPRPAPDGDESARRAQLARWHTDDYTTPSAAAQAVEEGGQR